MENTAFILIGLTLLLLTIIVGLLSFLIYKFLFQNFRSPTHQAEDSLSTINSNNKFHPEIFDRIKNLKKISSKNNQVFCPNHSDIPGEVSCAICDKIFCKICIKPFKTMHFCNEHLPLLMKNEWVDIITLKTSTTNPEKGVKLYEIKKEIFEKDQIPTYIETHYKINIDQDYIETYLVLYSIKENSLELKNKLNEYASYFET